MILLSKIERIDENSEYYLILKAQCHEKWNQFDYLKIAHN
jgi:hypothetical protein